MEQLELFVDRRSLFEKLQSTEFLYKGFKAVKKNKGAPGIDGVTIQDFEVDLDSNLRQLSEQIKVWKYKPLPVQRVEIPKPGKNAGVRLIGIPCVRDRVVQAALKLILEPILDPLFSDNSYGFRPNRNRQAVEAAQRIVKTGKEYVVDIDLSKRKRLPASFIWSLMLIMTVFVMITSDLSACPISKNSLFPKSRITINGRGIQAYLWSFAKLKRIFGETRVKLRQQFGNVM